VLKESAKHAKMQAGLCPVYATTEIQTSHISYYITTSLQMTDIHKLIHWRRRVYACSSHWSTRISCSMVTSCSHNYLLHFQKRPQTQPHLIDLFLSASLTFSLGCFFFYSCPKNDQR